MPADDDYATANRGGLKLKGVQNSRVDKHKKKHKKDKKDKKESHPPKDEASDQTTDAKNEEIPKTDDGSPLQREEHDPSTGARTDDSPHSPPSQSSKTEAERRHEEQRRKRVCHTESMLCSGSTLTLDASSMIV
jgi:FAM32A